MANDEIANDVTANDEIANDEIANDVTANDEIANDEIANDVTANDEIANDEIANDEIANDVTGTGGPGGTARDGERDAAEVGRLLDRLGAVEDILTVRKVFGEAYEVDGTTLVPVASVQGGGGGGIGEGTSPDGDGAGSGGGLGFGVRVRPLGVYSVRDGVVTWVPAFDVMRLVTGAQLVLVVALLVFGRRRRRRRS